MPNGDKLRPKNTREHLLAIYGYITGLKKDVKHMHDGIHDLGGKIDKIYWVLLGTVGAVSLLLLEKALDKGLVLNPFFIIFTHNCIRNINFIT